MVDILNHHLSVEVETATANNVEMDSVEGQGEPPSGGHSILPRKTCGSFTYWCNINIHIEN